MSNKKIECLSVRYNDIPEDEARIIIDGLTDPNSPVTAVSKHDDPGLLDKLIDFIQSANDIYEVQEFADNLFNADNDT